MADTRTVQITKRTMDQMKGEATIESGRADAARELGVDPELVEVRCSSNTSYPPMGDDKARIFEFATTWGVTDAPAT